MGSLPTFGALLSLCGERPTQRAAKSNDELAPPHHIIELRIGVRIAEIERLMSQPGRSRHCQPSPRARQCRLMLQQRTNRCVAAK